jgi:hypothetical protein
MKYKEIPASELRKNDYLANLGRVVELNDFTWTYDGTTYIEVYVDSMEESTTFGDSEIVVVRDEVDEE